MSNQGSCSERIKERFLGGKKERLGEKNKTWGGVLEFTSVWFITIKTGISDEEVLKRKNLFDERNSGKKGRWIDSGKKTTRDRRTRRVQEVPRLKPTAKRR